MEFPPGSTKKFPPEIPFIGEKIPNSPSQSREGSGIPTVFYSFPKETSGAERKKNPLFFTVFPKKEKIPLFYIFPKETSGAEWKNPIFSPSFPKETLGAKNKNSHFSHFSQWELREKKSCYFTVFPTGAEWKNPIILQFFQRKFGSWEGKSHFFTVFPK